ncbi:MAG: hypothetical protein K2W85_08360 [Phycisphaerales bacterium]|nr:hypothetical protein [Phycisphaerales bacterium]
MLRAAVTLGVVGLLSASSGAAIIYDARGPGNATVLIAERDEPDSLTELTPPGSGPREIDSRAGDRITFAGTDRFVTRFTTRVQAFNGSPVGITLGLQLSMFEVGAGGLPGALIWQGNASPVSLTSNAPVEAVFTPNVFVQNSICFGIAFTSVAVAPTDFRSFGVVSTALNQVGSSPTTRIRQATATGLWAIEDQTNQFNGIFHHIEARVEAVPSPGTATAILAASMAIARRRRRTA